MASLQGSGCSGQGLLVHGLSKHLQRPCPRVLYTPSACLAPSEKKGQGRQACRTQSEVHLTSSIDITHMTDAGAPLF